MIVGKQVKSQIMKKDKFDRRVKNLGKEEDEIVLTKADCEQSIAYCIVKLKELKANIIDYHKMLDKNGDLW